MAEGTDAIASNQSTPAIESPEQVFKKTVTGKFPLSKGISSARYWAPSEKEGVIDKFPSCETLPVNAPGVPRPNVDLNWLRFWSLIGGPLGLDHFYANSPATGIAKLLTLGGFGIWWIWDNLQLWLESDRVLNYGMMPPFDTRFYEPVAQGMITDKPQPYAWTLFSLWAICESIFGFLGFNLLFYKKAILAVCYAIFLGILIAVIYLSSIFNTFTIWEKVTYILASIFPAVVGIGHLWRWIDSAKQILIDSPEILLKDGKEHGLLLNPEVNKLINPYSTDVREDLETIHKGAVFESYTPEMLRRMFAIRPKEDKDNPNCINPDGAGDVFKALFEAIGKTLIDIVLSPLIWLKNGIWDAFKAIVSIFTNSSGKSETTTPQGTQNGGGVTEPLSTESLVLGGTLIALVLGGIIKGSVEHFVPS